MEIKYFSNINFSNNRISNFVLESVSNVKANIITLDGSVYYNNSRKKIEAYIDGSKQTILSGNIFSKYKIMKKDSTISNISPVIDYDTLTFQEGDNITIKANVISKTITISSNVDSTNNYSTLFGNTLSNSYIINHNLNTENVVVQVYNTTSTSGNVKVERYKINDANNITVYLDSNVSPNLSMKAVVNTSQGPRGVQGFQGTQGVQGFQGTQGVQGQKGDFPDFSASSTHSTFRLNSSKNVVATTIITSYDDGVIKRANVTTTLSDYGVILKSTGNVNIQSNVLRLEGLHSNANSDMFMLIDGYSKYNSNAYINTYSVTGNGVIFSNHLKMNSNGNVSSRRLVYADSAGKLHSSDREILNLDTQRKLKRILTVDEIEESYSNPILLLSAPGTNKYIEVIDVSFYYKYGSIPWNYTNSCGLVIDTCNGMLFTPNQDMLNSSQAFFQKGVPIYNNTTLTSYNKLNKGLYFKTLNANPSPPGDGTFVFHITYQIFSVV